MNRKQLIFLKQWLAKPNRKTIILRGPRQVGKSTLVRLFAEQQNRPLEEMNLERYPDLASAFQHNDPASLVNLLEALPNINSISPDSLLHQFVGEKDVPSAVRLDTGLPSTRSINTSIRQAGKALAVDYQLVSPPLYLAERLSTLKGIWAYQG